MSTSGQTGKVRSCLYQIISGINNILSCPFKIRYKNVSEVKWPFQGTVNMCMFHCIFTSSVVYLQDITCSQRTIKGNNKVSLDFHCTIAYH